MMNGQYWPEGDEVYHAELTVPVLLVHGMYDRFVPLQEDQRMAEVNILMLRNRNTPYFRSSMVYECYNQTITILIILNVLTDTASGLPESH